MIGFFQNRVLNTLVTNNISSSTTKNIGYGFTIFNRVGNQVFAGIDITGTTDFDLTGFTNVGESSTVDLDFNQINLTGQKNPKKWYIYGADYLSSFSVPIDSDFSGDFPNLKPLQNTTSLSIRSSNSIPSVGGINSFSAFTNFDINNFPKLETIFLSNPAGPGAIRDFNYGGTSLSDVTLESVGLTSFTYSNPEVLVNLNLGQIGSSRFTLGTANTNNLDLNLSGASNLINLTLNNAFINSLNLDGCTSLNSFIYGGRTNTEPALNFNTHDLPLATLFIISGPLDITGISTSPNTVQVINGWSGGTVTTSTNGLANKNFFISSGSPISSTFQYFANASTGLTWVGETPVVGYAKLPSNYGGYRIDGNRFDFVDITNIGNIVTVLRISNGNIQHRTDNGFYTLSGLSTCGTGITILDISRANIPDLTTTASTLDLTRFTNVSTLITQFSTGFTSIDLGSNSTSRLDFRASTVSGLTLNGGRLSGITTSFFLFHTVVSQISDESYLLPTGSTVCTGIYLTRNNVLTPAPTVDLGASFIGLTNIDFSNYTFFSSTPIFLQDIGVRNLTLPNVPFTCSFLNISNIFASTPILTAVTNLGNLSTTNGISFIRQPYFSATTFEWGTKIAGGGRLENCDMSTPIVDSNLDTIFINRNLFNNSIPRTLNIAGTNGPLTGTITQPLTGYSGSIHDQTEATITTASSGWTIGEKVWVLVNLRESDVSPNLRYRWTITVNV